MGKLGQFMAEHILDENDPHDKMLLEKFKRVIRGGQVIKKKVKPKSKGKGYKVSGGKVKKMGALETLRRRKAAKKTAKKLKSRKSQITRKRKKSNRKRKQIIGK